MKNKLNIEIENLIKEGDFFNFNNNKKLSSGTYFSQASQEFMTWVAKIEGLIRHNYSESSGPYSILLTVDKRHFYGYYEADFEEEITKLRSAIASCQTLQPNRKFSENPVMSLLKNLLFYPVLVVLVGAGYKLGFDNGTSSFDKEKIEMAKTIDSLSLNNRANVINVKQGNNLKELIPKQSNVKPSENSSTNNSSKINVTSNNQSGGQTAGEINNN